MMQISHSKSLKIGESVKMRLSRTQSFDQQRPLMWWITETRQALQKQKQERMYHHIALRQCSKRYAELLAQQKAWVKGSKWPIIIQLLTGMLVLGFALQFGFHGWMAHIKSLGDQDGELMIRLYSCLLLSIGIIGGVVKAEERWGGFVKSRAAKLQKVYRIAVVTSAFVGCLFLNILPDLSLSTFTRFMVYLLVDIVWFLLPVLLLWSGVAMRAGFSYKDEWEMEDLWRESLNPSRLQRSCAEVRLALKEQHVLSELIPPSKMEPSLQDSNFKSSKWIRWISRQSIKRLFSLKGSESSRIPDDKGCMDSLKPASSMTAEALTPQRSSRRL